MEVDHDNFILVFRPFIEKQANAFEYITTFLSKFTSLVVPYLNKIDPGPQFVVGLLRIRPFPFAPADIDEIVRYTVKHDPNYLRLLTQRLGWNKDEIETLFEIVQKS